MGFGSQACQVRVAATSRVGRNVGLGAPEHDSGGDQQGLGGPVRPLGAHCPSHHLRWRYPALTKQSAVWFFPELDGVSLSESGDAVVWTQQ